MDLLDSFWVDSFFHAFPLCFHTDRSDRHWWCEVASGNVPAVGNPIWTMTSAPRNASAARVVSHHLTVAPATPATIDTAQWFKHNKNERQVEKPPALLGCNLLRLGQNCEIVELWRFWDVLGWIFHMFHDFSWYVFWCFFGNVWSALRQMLVCQQLTWVALAVSHRWQMALIGLWQVSSYSRNIHAYVQFTILQIQITIHLFHGSERRWVFPNIFLLRFIFGQRQLSHRFGARFWASTSLRRAGGIPWYHWPQETSSCTATTSASGPWTDTANHTGRGRHRGQSEEYLSCKGWNWMKLMKWLSKWNTRKGHVL